MAANTELGKLIRTARANRNMTMKTVTGRMNDKAGLVYYNRIELGREIPKSDILEMIGNILGISYDKLATAAKIDKLNKYTAKLEIEYRPSRKAMKEMD